MKRLEDFPNSVRVEAERLCAGFEGEQSEGAILLVVANAIISERERCAKIAEGEAGAIRLGGIRAFHGAANIARKIRGGEPA